jgi:hypothetical protein
LILAFLLGVLLTNATSKPMTFAKPRPFGPRFAILPPGSPISPKFDTNAVPCTNCFTLGWDDTNTVDGFNLYWGVASRNYTNFLFTANHSATVSNLVYGSTYYFAATATLGGMESDFSSETNATVGWEGVTVTYQASDDLQAWQDSGSFTYQWFTTNQTIPPHLFWRLKINRWP